jgi:hypothetical protein
VGIAVPRLTPQIIPQLRAMCTACISVGAVWNRRDCCIVTPSDFAIQAWRNRLPCESPDLHRPFLFVCVVCVRPLSHARFCFVLRHVALTRNAKSARRRYLPF